MQSVANNWRLTPAMFSNLHPRYFSVLSTEFFACVSKTTSLLPAFSIVLSLKQSMPHLRTSEIGRITFPSNGPSKLIRWQLSCSDGCVVSCVLGVRTYTHSRCVYVEYTIAVVAAVLQRSLRVSMCETRWVQPAWIPMLIFSVCRTRRNEVFAEWGKGKSEGDEKSGMEAKDASEAVSRCSNERAKQQASRYCNVLGLSFDASTATWWFRITSTLAQFTAST